MLCVEELGLSELRDIRTIAVGTRGANAEKFDEFLDGLEPPEETLPKDDTDLHAKNLAIINKT